MTNNILLVLFIAFLALFTQSASGQGTAGPMTITVCVAPSWAGYIGGWWYNMGMMSNQYSYFLRDYNLAVNFMVVSDRAAAFSSTNTS